MIPMLFCFVKKAQTKIEKKTKKKLPNSGETSIWRQIWLRTFKGGGWLKGRF